MRWPQPVILNICKHLEGRDLWWVMVIMSRRQNLFQNRLYQDILKTQWKTIPLPGNVVVDMVVSYPGHTYEIIYNQFRLGNWEAAQDLQRLPIGYDVVRLMALFGMNRPHKQPLIKYKSGMITADEYILSWGMYHDDPINTIALSECNLPDIVNKFDCGSPQFTRELYHRAQQQNITNPLLEYLMGKVEYRIDPANFWRIYNVPKTTDYLSELTDTMNMQHSQLSRRESDEWFYGMLKLLSKHTQLINTLIFWSINCTDIPNYLCELFYRYPKITRVHAVKYRNYMTGEMIRLCINWGIRFTSLSFAPRMRDTTIQLCREVGIPLKPSYHYPHTYTNYPHYHNIAIGYMSYCKSFFLDPHPITKIIASGKPIPKKYKYICIDIEESNPEMWYKLQ
jgi:hypothetical protein